MGWGSGISDPEKPYLGSGFRGQKASDPRSGSSTPISIGTVDGVAGPYVIACNNQYIL
jgi:hypothetical protein